MTVDQLLTRLAAAFPAFTPAALEAWAPVYRAKFARHEGPALARAYLETLAGFSVARSRALFPVPANFEAHLPGTARSRPTAGSARLDFAARKQRQHRLMAAWRDGQGRRASRGVAELMRALEDIAWRRAELAAWAEDPPALALSRAELRLGLRRALSLQRRREHGPPAGTPDLWWDQIAAIARRWDVAVTREDWSL